MSDTEDPASPLRGLAAAARSLAGALSLDEVLRRIAETGTEVTGARYAALGVIGEGDRLDRFIHTGMDAAIVAQLAHEPRGLGVLGLLIRHPQTVRLDDLAKHPASYGFPENHPPMSSFLGTPVRSGGRVYGNLYLTEKAGGFTALDEEVVVVLAAQAGAAIENAILSARLQMLAVQDERDRIARELHDGIIQTLFSIGMGLEAARASLHSAPDRVEQRLDWSVSAIDDAIRELRSQIYQLRPAQAADFGLARGLVELAREHEANALTRPDLVLPDRLDEVVPDVLVPDLIQIVREALANVAKHAHASTARVEIRVDDGSTSLVIADDGGGFEPGRPVVGRGLDNIRERCETMGASLDVASDSTGTTLTVTLPPGRSGGVPNPIEKEIT